MSLPGIEKIILWSDTHCKYVDLERVKVLGEVIKQEKPDHCVGLGDTVDFTGLSKFPDAISGPDLRDELASAHEVLDILKPTHLRKGNHEKRPQRPGGLPPQVWGMLDAEKLLDCKRRGIKWYDYDKYDKLKFGYLSCFHGYGGRAITALAEMANDHGCVVCGHFHTQVLVRPSSSNQYRMAATIGHLSLDLPYEVGERPTQHTPGFAMAYVHRNNHFQLYLMSLIGSNYVINGKVYRR